MICCFEVELVRRLFTDPRFAPPELAPSRGAARPNRRGSTRQEDRQRQNVTVSGWEQNGVVLTVFFIGKSGNWVRIDV